MRTMRWDGFMRNRDELYVDREPDFDGSDWSSGIP
jgi:hypothetical protein